MKSIYKFIVLFIGLTTFSSYIHAQGKSGFKILYYEIEWVSLGTELLTGDISNMLKPGLHASSCNFNLGFAKNPKFTIGLTLLDSGSHDYAANNSEQQIIENYAIVKTTTDGLGNKTTEIEPLEKIRMTRFNFGIPLTFQQVNPEKMLNYHISLIPSIYNFSTNMPKEGDIEVKDKLSGGVALKLAVDYQLKNFQNGRNFLRLSYGLYTNPDLDMLLIPGIRPLSGAGLAHAIQIGFGMRNLKVES